MSNEDHAPPSEVKATSRLRRILSRAWAVLRNSVLAAVNPRFSTFSYALTLAIIVGLMTFGAVVGITFSLMSECSKSCGLRPVVWLEPEEAPKWYTPLQKAISVSYGTKHPLKASTCINNEVSGASNPWLLQGKQLPVRSAALPTIYDRNRGRANISLNAYSPTWVSSKCSVLHTADCGRKEWAALYQGLLAIGNVSRGLPAVWPTSAAYSSYTADAALQAVFDMDRSAPPTLAESRQLLAGRKVQLRLPAMPECFPGINSKQGLPSFCYMALGEGQAAGMTIFQAPPEAKCCNVTLRASEAGTSWDRDGMIVNVPDVYNGTLWALEVRGRQDPNDACLEYTGADYKGECTAVWMQAQLAVEPPTLGRMMFCSNFRNATGRLLPMRSWGPGYACQQVTDGSHTCFTSDSHWQAEEVDLADFFDLSTQQCASNLSFTYDYTTDASSPSYVRPRPYEEQAAAAVGYLLPTLYQYGRVVSWYMANASITQNTTRSGDLAMSSDNAVAKYWIMANLYCCTCNYPDLLSSLGSALGYSGYIEVVVTLVVLLVYLQMVRADNNRLRLNLAALARIAMEQEDKEGDDTGDATPCKPGSDDDGAAATVTLVKPTAKGAASDTPMQLVSQATILASAAMEGAQPSPRAARRGPASVREAGSLPGVAG